MKEKDKVIVPPKPGEFVRNDVKPPRDERPNERPAPTPNPPKKK